VVRPKREHYRRKDNPAVILIRNVIAHKDDHAPKQHDYFQESRYDNMTYSFNNFDDGWQAKWRKQFKFIDEFIDTALVSGGPVLPVISDERIEHHYYRRSDNLSRKVTEAEQHAGLDDMLPESFVALLKTEVFPEMDLAEDNIYLYRKKFVSPISSFAPTFYKYYILDTLTMADNQRYIDLGFAPALPQSFGFVGHLYVSLDSTYWVRHAELNIPPDINLNFVRNLHLEIENDRLADSTRVIRSKKFYTELNITTSSLGMYAQRTICYDNFSAQPLSPTIFEAMKESESPLLRKQSTDQDYWNQYRPIGNGYDPDHSVLAMVTRMRKVPLYRYVETGLTWLFKGYVPVDAIAEEDAKFLYGPINTTASWNALEHMRFRAGGMTTANVNPHLFARGFVAWGLYDHRWKGDAAVEYSFRRKKNYANEFPIHSVTLESQYDTRNIGIAPQINRDNFLNSLSRPSDPKYSYVQDHSLLYTLEFWNHFSLKLKGEWRREYESRLGLFEDGLGQRHPHYDMALGTVQLRWAPKEAFAQMKSNRVRVDHRHPVFELTHKVARQGFMGTEFDFQSTEFSFEKRFWMSVLGFADVNIDCGKVWTAGAPYTLLFMPKVNTGYTVQSNTFSQLQSMEFVYDQYAHWNIEWRLMGLLLNEVPYLRHLKWREVVGFRGVYGSLSAKNDPDLHPELYRFPTNGTVYRLGDAPYMEVSVGLMNIFKFFRIEYIRRLNYLHHPGIHKNGLLVGMEWSF